MFTLHPQLVKDTYPVGDFSLCRLLLMDDAQYPWFILVPRRVGIREIHELSDADQQQLTRESVLLSRALLTLFRADKLNIAALGNMVPQLHLHHIVRYTDDPAWPKPVWGLLPPRHYAQANRLDICRGLATRLHDFRPHQSL